MAKNDVSWLLRQPIAHRGLHDLDKGLPENTLPAIEAAIKAGYAIEVDVQLSRDGVPVVFHDYDLERLTGQSGKVAIRAAHELAKLNVLNTAATVPLFSDLLTSVDGRAPLLVEIKPQSSRNAALVTAVHKAIAGYQGQIALMSFDVQMLFQSRQIDPSVPLGALSPLPDLGKKSGALDHFITSSITKTYAHWLWTQPDFIAHKAQHLPSFWPIKAASLFNVPLLTWTVRSEDERTRLEPFVDQIIFEGFLP